MIDEGPTKTDVARKEILNYLEKKDGYQTKELKDKIVPIFCSQRIFFNIIKDLRKEGIVSDARRGYIVLKSKEKQFQTHTGAAVLEKIAVEQGRKIIEKILEFQLNSLTVMERQVYNGFIHEKDFDHKTEDMIKKACHSYFYIVVQIENKKLIKFERPWEGKGADPDYNIGWYVVGKGGYKPELYEWLIFITNVVDKLE